MSRYQGKNPSFIVPFKGAGWASRGYNKSPKGPKRSSWTTGLGKIEEGKKEFARGVNPSNALDAAGKVLTLLGTPSEIAATTSIRKRYSTLINELDEICHSEFRQTHVIQIGRCTCSFLKFQISGCQVVCSSDKESEYRGEDIALLSNYNNYYPWQKSVYKMISNVDSTGFRKPDTRTIHWIWDPHGNTGKSLFVKFLCVNNPDDILKISFGTPNQLRSSLISGGTIREVA